MPPTARAELLHLLAFHARYVDRRMLRSPNAAEARAMAERQLAALERRYVLTPREPRPAHGDPRYPATRPAAAKPPAPRSDPSR